MHYSQESEASFDQAIEELRNSAHRTGSRHLGNLSARSGFIGEVELFISHIQSEINSNCLSIRSGEVAIREETQNILKQDADLISGNIKMYIAIQSIRDPRKNAFTLFLKQVGFVGGGVQMFVGGSACAASLGLACASFGAPLMAHGINNAHENGYYLLFRKSTTGYTRDAYRYIGKQFGYNTAASDIMFSAVDLVLSGYGMSRNVLRGDARRLFRYMDDEFIRGWKEAGRLGLTTEVINDGVNIYTIQKINGEF